MPLTLMLKRNARTAERLRLIQRCRVFQKTVDKVTKDYSDPKFNGRDWTSIAADARETILRIDDPEEFELSMHSLVRKLGTSHTGFFHRSVKRVPARLAIGATLGRTETDSGRLWIVQDVHAGGPAHLAGIRRGDLLLRVHDKKIGPDEQPMFPMGIEVAVSILRGTEESTFRISIPNPRSRKQPYAEPQAVSWRVLSEGVGYLQVTILPGLLGLDVARETDQAVAQLDCCESLILDLRGHLGGGLAVLRLMSYLTPDKRPIGYTVTRKRAERGYEKAKLPNLDKLPTHLSNSLAIASMAAKFAGRDPSVMLVSEGLGAKR